MKKLLLYFPVLIFLAFLLKSCGFENPTTVSESQSVTGTGENQTDEVREKIFMANIILQDNSVVGSLGVFKESTRLSFEFEINSPKYIKNFHFGYSPMSMHFPMTGSCPNIENFQKVEHNLPASTHKYIVKLPSSIFTTVPRDTYTLYGAAQMELESSSDHPDCTYAWVAGANFPNCSTFGKYFLMKEITWNPSILR